MELADDVFPGHWDGRLEWPEVHAAHAVRLIALAAVALAVNFVALRGLMQSALPDGHDVRPHLVNTSAYARSFEQGVTWPRWLPDLAAGYGGANPLFYSPLPFQLSGRMVAAGATPVDALRWSALVAVLLGFAGVWCWALRAHAAGTYASPPWAFALTAATLYTLAPYHLFDLYGRFAYPELLAMGLAPWLLAVLERPATRSWVALGAGLALLWLVHNLSVILFGALLGARALALCVRERSAAPLATLIRAGALAAALAAFSWVPAVIEMHQTRIAADRSMSEFWRAHMLGPARMFENGWPGTRRHMPLYPGRLHLALAVLAIGAFAGIARREDDGARRAATELVFAAGTAALGALCLTWSAPLWAATPLPMMQFPWRFLGPACLGLSLVGAGTLLPLPRRAATLLALALVAAVALTYAPLCANEPYRGPERSPADLADHVETGDFENKYLPLGAHVPADADRPLFEAVEGEARVEALATGPHHLVARIVATSPALIEIRQYMYEGWNGSLDGAPLRLEREDALGGMRVRVPAGEHVLALAFALTPLRAWALFTSVAASALVLVLLSGEVRRLRAGAWLVLAIALAGTLLLAIPRALPLTDAWHAERAELAIAAGRTAAAREQLAAIDPSGPFARWAAAQDRVQRECGAVVQWYRGTFETPLDRVRLPLLDIDNVVEPARFPVNPPLSALITADIDIPVAGRWLFATESDDGSQLWLCRRLIVENGGLHQPRRREGAVDLSAGRHELVVLFENPKLRGLLRVWWKPPGRAWSLVPQRMLHPAHFEWGRRLATDQGALAAED